MICFQHVQQSHYASVVDAMLQLKLSDLLLNFQTLLILLPRSSECARKICVTPPRIADVI